MSTGSAPRSAAPEDTTGAPQRSPAPVTHQVPPPVDDELGQRRTPLADAQATFQPPAYTQYDEDAATRLVDADLRETADNKPFSPQQMLQLPSTQQGLLDRHPVDLNTTQATSQHFFETHPPIDPRQSPLLTHQRALSRASASPSAFQKVRHETIMTPRQTGPPLMTQVAYHPLNTPNLALIQEAYDRRHRSRPESSASNHSAVTLSAATVQELQRTLAMKMMQEQQPQPRQHTSYPVPQPQHYTGHPPMFEEYQVPQMNAFPPAEPFSPGTDFGNTQRGQHPFSFAPTPSVSHVSQHEPLLLQRQQTGTPLSRAPSTLTHGMQLNPLKALEPMNGGYEQKRHESTLLADLRLRSGVT